MNLQVFFTFFGGKWRIAKSYPEPTRKTIIEPFAGSAGYSLRYPEHEIILYDADPVICATWDYLIHVSEQEIMDLPTEITDLREMDLPQGAKHLIGFWLNKASIAPKNIPSKWMRGIAAGIYPASVGFWDDNIKDRIVSQLRHIRHWQVFCEPYTSIPNQDACWFIDPPYTKSGHLYKYHDIDYKYLHCWCRTRIGQTIVCEQDGADWLPFLPFREAKALEGKKGSKKIKEAIWYNEVVV